MDVSGDISGGKWRHFGKQMNHDAAAPASVPLHWTVPSRVLTESILLILGLSQVEAWTNEWMQSSNISIFPCYKSFRSLPSSGFYCSTILVSTKPSQCHLYSCLPACLSVCLSLSLSLSLFLTLSLSSLGLSSFLGVLPCLKWYADAPISKSQGRKIKESSLSFFSVWSWILWSSCFSLFQCFLSPIHARQQITKWSW